LILWALAQQGYRPKKMAPKQKPTDPTQLCEMSGLMFCDFPNSNVRLMPPRRAQSMSGFWFAPTGKHEAAVEFSEDFDYVLVRVRSPEKAKVKTRPAR
jgi:hypothetical protein